MAQGANTNGQSQPVYLTDAVGAAAGTSAAPLSTTPTVFNGTTSDPQRKPNQTARIVSAAASVNSTAVKTTAGDVFVITGYNANAAARYLKLYNKATAPTIGTDTPVLTEYLPPLTKFSLTVPPGMYFSAGIGLGLTTGSADADTGALTAGDILGLNVIYA